ncbi:hypothetical protein DS2_07823 [Catenovulum agarivorans DS-2]|uniref:3-keto-alpha-glucoside-1,2-lyase/3-keto-2-hydroxy-glucal hydratase domain-containing protein n=1 Tax=Catenovulum agarivorans DS-2 TaxID=1328313 RepID=W7QYQ8_9ALTE|nr:DUF1080 domain-containing protein [Catenovulum agarivorans]EWH10525.1 hypothetical protein DS2_07823 [Catenovulum agarivorans DS-2]
MKLNIVAAASLAMSLTVLTACSTTPDQAAKQQWVNLFNGENLDGWTIKFKNKPVGENYNNTFRVENGLLTVNYDNWQADEAGLFGHIFTNSVYSDYRIRVEYRFIGEQLTDNPKLAWAYRNNGVMLHSQSPQSMELDQAFPISGESQLLGGDGNNPRNTGNFCSPGTNIVKDGQLITKHCIKSNSATFHGEQWVWFEAEVHSSGKVKHFINGELVLEYDELQIDPTDPLGAKWLQAGNPLKLTAGHIALQAETHPTQFRTIQIQPLN